MLNSQMKFLAVMLVFAFCASGCTTHSREKEKEHEAFLAGQNAALRRELPQTAGVTIRGPVQNPQVPWVDGLTLAQAIATAVYLDAHEPKQIVITRNGESAAIDPSVLLNGTKIPLQPGDIIEIQPQ